MITPPFDADQLIDAGYEMVLPENVTQVRDRPRASGLASCARQIAYQMAGVEATDSPRGDPARAHSVFTTEQGRYVEDLTCDVIAKLPTGVRVVNRQISLPENYPVTGHPDGELEFQYDEGHGPQWYGTAPDGKKWGFEHKHLGRFGYLEVFKDGFAAAKPDYMTQLLMYGDALGWDAAVVVVLAQDGSSTTYERNTALRAYKQSKDPAKAARHQWATREDWNPKVQVFAIDLREYAPLVPSFRRRAEELAAAAGSPDAVRREYSGDRNFPCGYCAFQSRCQVAGDGTVSVTPPALGGIA